MIIIDSSLLFVLNFWPNWSWILLSSCSIPWINCFYRSIFFCFYSIYASKLLVSVLISWHFWSLSCSISRSSLLERCSASLARAFSLDFSSSNRSCSFSNLVSWLSSSDWVLSSLFSNSVLLFVSRTISYSFRFISFSSSMRTSVCSFLHFFSCFWRDAMSFWAYLSLCSIAYSYCYVCVFTLSAIAFVFSFLDASNLSKSVRLRVSFLCTCKSCYISWQ